MKTGAYRHRIVRDLAWAIGAPPIIEVIWPPVAPWSPFLPARPYVISDRSLWPDSTAFGRAFEGAKSILGALDEHPEDLVEFVGKSFEGRRGIYFERLIEYWLRRSGSWTQVLADRPVTVDGRTVGQFDFLLQDGAGKWTHLEIAVKYYLQLGDAADLSGWVGTNLIERLDQKLAHLLFHQIRLDDHAEPLVPISDRIVYLKGLLFWANLTEIREQDQAPDRWWCTTQQFLERAANWSDTSWAIADSRSWFPGSREEDFDSLLDPETLVEDTLDRTPRTPVLVVGLRDGYEVTRGCLYNGR